MRHARSCIARTTVRRLALIVSMAVIATSAESSESRSVRAVEERVVIPTYQIGPADRNPMFYVQESYQGAQKRIYPYALQDHLSHDRIDQTYTMLRLENEFVALSVLPELGGRLFSATDKTNGYDFFYRQHVIKPALIGMLGAWISGGIEWCAFHHHRNTTFMPVDHTLVENEDGSKTIWIGETERRHRMKWLIGLTLYPDRSYIEATIKFFNRTPQPHSILYWANVAVHVNDDYQVFFPPSVQVATYHSKIDFTHWPIASGRYRGHDYSGKDLSWWKNSPVSNSFFAWDLREDFMGGYDHGRRAGVVHVGNHHLVCGAKLWEWGTGEQGRAWDQILTDDDGPYAELMVGAFSDNQPDYSWIQPHEVKTVKQYWYPVKEIGGFKNANLHGAVNLELRPDLVASVGVCTTSRRPGSRLVVKSKQDVLCEETVDIAPGQPLLREIRVPAGTRESDVHVALLASDGKPLISYQPVERPPVDTLPKPVAPPAKPADISSVEELYLAGLRIEQIHNPSVDPRDYYREALRRDPDDTRCNTMIGIHCLRRGLPEEAETHLRRAVDRLTRDYTRAREGEAHYQLGLALRALHREQEAYDQFYRAAWDRKFHSPAYFQLAELSCRRGDYAQALEQIERSLSTNTLDTNALGLQAALLRRLDRPADAASVAAAALAIDPLDFRAHNERYLSQMAGADPPAAAETLERLTCLMRDDVQAYLELATDYMHAGLWLDALQVLQRPVRGNMQPAGSYPLVHYYLGYLHLATGDQAEAAACFAQGSAAPTDYCFPFRWETAEVLQTALQANPNDARAEYYLGNLLFDLQPDAAIAHWERARTLDESLAIVHRNLGWAFYRVKNDLSGAIGHYEKAVSCNQRDPRLFLELDLLYEFANVPPDRRLAALQANHAIVAEREDSLLREIMVLVLTGNHGQAIRYLAENRFHAQEGRSEIHDIFVDAHLLEGLRLMRAQEFQEALAHFLEASEYPENLSVGRPRNDPRAAEVNYHAGIAYKSRNNPQSAAECFRKAAEQQETGSWPLTRYYQALSMIELGRRDEAKAMFDGLIGRGRDQLAKGTSADFFAKFGEQETRRSQEASAHFLIGLGLAGKGDRAAAREQFAAAVKLNVSHVWARYHLAESP